MVHRIAKEADPAEGVRPRLLQVARAAMVQAGLPLTDSASLPMLFKSSSLARRQSARNSIPGGASRLYGLGARVWGLGCLEV